MNRCIAQTVLALLFCVSVIWLTKSVAAAEMLELAVTGDSNQTFKGDCYLLQKSGNLIRQKIKGVVPAHFWFPARAFKCNIQKNSASARLEAKVIHEGAVMFVQVSRPPLRWVLIRSAGPWGEAAGGVYAARPVYN